MKYVSLHHHSTFSFLDGYGLPDEHVARAAELDMAAIALTEHGNVSSHPRLEKAARKAGIKPVFGCELYTGNGQPTKRKNHLTVWAENDEGYRNLLRLVSWAWREGFYYEPTVQGPAFARYSGGLIVASGCRGSLLATSIVGGKNIDPADASEKRGRRIAERFRDLLGDRYYLEVQGFPELEDTARINQALERIGDQLAIPLVATADVHYCKREDYQMQVILHATRPGTRRTAEEQERSWGYDVPLSTPTSDRYMLERLRNTGLTKRAAAQAISNTHEIAERCTVELPKAAPMRYPGKRESRALFRDWLRRGWHERKISERPSPQQYAERLRYEVSVIEDKDFVDYFLIVSDMVRWAKDHGIFVGPARGSAAASLVCYLLRITEVDPLNPMYGADLIFERFIDITRVDMPDIDLDFDDDRRHEVYQYLRSKYGEERCNQLGTFTFYKSKNSLDDVAHVYQVPKWELDKVKDLLIERSSGDLRASATIEDTIEMFDEVREVFDQFPDLRHAMRLEGMVKGMGRHAAGVIVSSQPLTDTCAVYDTVISMDKRDAEYLGLLKMDNLGLSTCGMISEAFRLLGKDPKEAYDIALDDPETLRGFQENDVVGIFQFDGRAMRLVNHALQPDSFYEVCVVNALARPGPLHNNATLYYTDIKHGLRKPEAMHPVFDAIVANTQWQVVYQEQILRILREIGTFDWTSLMYVRNIIKHKEGEQKFQSYWKMFWKGAKQHGLTREQAKQIWGLCITAGAYAFNAAHSVSYGMLAWYTMWIKRHHPRVFYLAALRRLPDTKHLELMRDAARHGIRVLPPDPARSGMTWRMEGKHSLRAGFAQIPGIGEKMGTAIVEWRNGNGEHAVKWEDLIGVKGIGEKTILKILAWVQQEDPLEVYVLDRKLKEVVEQIEQGKLKMRDGSLLPMPTHTVATLPYRPKQATTIVWIGIVVHRNLRDLYEVNLSRTGVPLDPATVKDPDLREWVLMHGHDGDEPVTLTINRWRYPKFKDAIWGIRLGRDIVLVRGFKRKDDRQRTRIEVTGMWVTE